MKPTNPLKFGGERSVIFRRKIGCSGNIRRSEPRSGWVSQNTNFQKNNNTKTNLK